MIHLDHYPPFMSFMTRVALSAQRFGKMVIQCETDFLVARDADSKKQLHTISERLQTIRGTLKEECASACKPHEEEIKWIKNKYKEVEQYIDRLESLMHLMA